MSVKLSPRVKKSRVKDEIRPEVHKTIKRDVSSDREQCKTETSEDGSDSYRNYLIDERSENYNVLATPSREISVDGESQINSKIITLIENEMKRENNKHHFTDSRPQSLSFYEEEKMPEELSGKRRNRIMCINFNFLLL